MVARLTGATLGLFAFAVTTVAGLLVQNSVSVTLSRGLFALFVFFLTGFLVGAAAQLVINDHVRKRETSLQEQYADENPSAADAPPGPDSARAMTSPPQA